MHLREALGVASADDIDPSVPLVIGQFRFGSEAAEEAIRILRGGDFPPEVNVVARMISEPVHWSISHQVEGNAEILSVPGDQSQSFSTALEVALLRALAALEPAQQPTVLGGNVDILLGSSNALRHFYKIIQILRTPLVGSSILHGGGNQAILDAAFDTRLTKPILNCLSSSLLTAPLKFRYLEIYRIMEAQFLADVKSKLVASFDAEPTTALSDASEALKSEMLQLIGLAELQQDAFEACWIVLDAKRNTNRFCAALFRKLGRKGPIGGTRWKNGAALVYFIRCAIVHAGERDIVYDNFADGEDLVIDVLPNLERASLLLIGIRLA